MNNTNSKGTPKKKSRKKPRKKAKFHLLSETEKEYINDGASVMTASLMEARIACKSDIMDTVLRLAVFAKDHSKSGWLDGDNKDLMILERIEIALRNLILDRSPQTRPGYEAGTYDCGIEDVKELAVSMLETPEAIKSDQYELRMIHACLITLVASGQVQKAHDLLNFAGALNCIINQEDGSKCAKNTHSQTSADLTRLVILKIAKEYLDREEIPTLKALRNKLSGGMDGGRFSRLIKDLKIREVLPEAPKRTVNPEEKPIIKAKTICNGSDDSIHTESRERDLHVMPHKQSVMRPPPSIKPSGNPEMFDCEMRIIKEQLGPIYYLILIIIGKNDSIIRTPEEFAVFE